ncbi:MAG: T9SS type A sorting domain-containing protein [Bacteroidota bacterium]
MLKFSSLFFFLLNLFSLYAQDHKDCFDALDISGLSEFIFADSMKGAGLDRVELDQSICLDNPNNSGFEVNSFWLTWTVETSGSLIFNITPLAEKDDLDFFLFRLKEDKDCESREEVRCMTSGDRFFPSPCMGETGLRFGEMDLNEGPGCRGTDNNFLAPVEVSVGEQYVLAITNFTSREYGFKIEFCGTAASPLADSSSCPISSIDQILSADSELHIFPNPTMKGRSIISLSSSASKGNSIEVYDLAGKEVSTIEIQQIAPKKWTFDTSQLPQGTYFVVFKDSDVMINEKLVVTGL